MNWLNTPCIAFEGSKTIAEGALRDVAVVGKAAMDRVTAATHPLPLLIFDERSSETIELDWRGSELEFLKRLGQRAEQMDALVGTLDAQTTAATSTPAETAARAASANRAAKGNIEAKGNIATGMATACVAAPLSPCDAESSTEGELVDARRGPGRPRLGVVAREVTLLPRHWDWLATQSGGASVALRKLVEVARLSSEVKDRARRAREVAYKFMSTMAGHEVGFEEASRALFAGHQAGLEAQIAHWPEDVQKHLKTLLTHAFEVSP